MPPITQQWLYACTILQYNTHIGTRRYIIYYLPTLHKRHRHGSSGYRTGYWYNMCCVCIQTAAIMPSFCPRTRVRVRDKINRQVNIILFNMQSVHYYTRDWFFEMIAGRCCCRCLPSSSSSPWPPPLTLTRFRTIDYLLSLNIIYGLETHMI